MGILKKLEETAAKKLMRVFLDSKKYADTAVEDLSKAEKELENAKVRAAEATQRQHEAAIEASQKAKQVAEELSLEAKAAEERAAYYEEVLKQLKSGV